MLNGVTGKKHCANFKKGKCVSVVNPQPFDNFKIFSSRVGSNQRCNACLAFYVKKQACLNFKKGQCFASENPQTLDNFIKKPGNITKNKICRACENSDKKYCSNYKKGTCASSVNPQPIVNFMPRHGKLHGYSQCQDCVNKYYGVNKVRIRKRLRKWVKENGINALRRDRLYALESGQFNQMFKDQQGCCGICHKHQSELKQTLVVDHDHATNQVRGLLCSSCNRALGYFYDCIESLASAIDYLKRTT